MDSAVEGERDSPSGPRVEGAGAHAGGACVEAGRCGDGFALLLFITGFGQVRRHHGAERRFEQSEPPAPAFVRHGVGQFRTCYLAGREETHLHALIGGSPEGQTGSFIPQSPLRGGVSAEQEEEHCRCRSQRQSLSPGSHRALHRIIVLPLPAGVDPLPRFSPMEYPERVGGTDG